VFTDDILTAASYAKAGIPTMLHTQVANETDPNFDFCECNSGALRYPRLVRQLTPPCSAYLDSANGVPGGRAGVLVRCDGDGLGPGGVELPLVQSV
jgi:hypothetical protein